MACSVFEYAIPTVALGSGDAVVMTTGGGNRLTVNARLVNRGPLVTRTVNVNEPYTVGVPLSTPPPESARPAGKASLPGASAQLYVPAPAPPVAARVTGP